MQLQFRGDGLVTRRRIHPDIVFPGERPRPVEPTRIPPDPLAGLDEETRRRLPNLIGIGAAKCGTSALHTYLAAHPEIAMSEEKELKLFGSARWHERLPWYASRFDGGCAVRGETSPTYTMDPYVPGVPEQIAAVLGEPKLIYTVGDPVRRVIAHYQEHVAMSFERRTLHEALADADDPANPYVAASRYGHQLRRYLEVFDPSRILIVDQDDLRHRRRETLRGIFAFAGVDADFWSPAFEAEPNARGDKFQPNRLGLLLIDHSRARPRLLRKAMIPRVTMRRVADVPIDARTRAGLERVLGPDIDRFRELTGRSFADWRV